jgi:UDP-N-acetylglucosamine--N-acetylmuramyl-(pentapeptide) pyrophosphoryl-undecaprenol N-acetylglucosamine transferase
MKDIVVVTGGGTGGHLSVARAIINELHKRKIQVIFVGSTSGADKQWFENNTKISQKYFLNTKGVVNQNLIGKFISLALILKGMLKVLSIFKKHKVTKVISVGGFSAASASFASYFSKVDFYIHEQNSIMGKLNQLTSKYAKKVFSSYDTNLTIVDYPVDKIFFENNRIRKEIKTIIFLGGSQGAKAINNFALSVALFLKEQNINIIHQTGKLDFQRVKQEYETLGIEVDIFDFTTNIIDKMNLADFAISRAGASTLWELTALGLPTLYIPYPYAYANHQYHNAKFLANKNLCFLRTENELNVDDFKQILKQNISNISKKLSQNISPNGIKNIIDTIIK